MNEIEVDIVMVPNRQNYKYVGMSKKLIKCPFNQNHILSPNRIVFHIVKCKRTYGGNKVPCPFNATEYIEPEGLADHLLKCPNRIARESQFYYSVGSGSVIDQKEAPFIHDGIPDIEENWGVD